jgi:tRNA pseudouridine13 synthase
VADPEDEHPPVTPPGALPEQEPAKETRSAARPAPDLDRQSAEGRPRIRACPEDFVVDEVPLYEPSGEGGHTFVRIEKRQRTTEEAVRQLARAAGVSARDIGYAGRKDRGAVTRQWISVPGLAPELAETFELDGVRVLEAIAHGHKLRTGQLRANRFQIRVRGVSDALEARAAAALQRLVATGMPNRFGAQRFGREGRNAERALAALRGERVRVDRRALRFLFSALQSEVFNRVLAERALPLDAVELGDVAQVCESGGLFVVEDLAAEAPRAAKFEISATGPIFGTKMKAPTGEVARREAEALEAVGVPSAESWQLPRGVRLRGARRPFRVRPEQAELRREDDAVVVSFELPTGSYATVLLEELFGEVTERDE